LRQLKLGTIRPNEGAAASFFCQRQQRIGTPPDFRGRIQSVDCGVVRVRRADDFHVAVRFIVPTEGRDSLAHEEDRLSPLAEVSEERRRSGEGRGRHLVAQTIDAAWILQMSFLDRASRRHEDAQPSFQSVNLVDELQWLPCEFD
jgi:hypothetical protein